MEAAHHPWPALGALLLRDGLVEKDELEEVLVVQEDAGHHRLSARRLGELLVERGAVTPAQVAQLVAEQYELPYLELATSDVNLRAAALITEEQAHEFVALPISVLPDASVLVAVADPPLVLFSDEFRRLLGVSLRYAVAARDELDAAIAYALADSPAEHDAAEVDVPAELAVVISNAETEDVLTVTPDEPATTLVVPEHPRAHRSAALGALLVRDGLVTEDELDTALAQQRIAGNKRLGEIFVERGTVTRTQVAQLVAEQYDLPFIELDLPRIQVEAALLLPESLAHHLSALPLGRSADGSLLVAVSDPTNVVYADELRDALDAPIHFTVVTPAEIDEAIHYVHVHVPDALPVTEPEHEWEDAPAAEVEAEAEELPVETGDEHAHVDDDLLAEVGEVADAAFASDPYPEILAVRDEPLAEVLELPGDSARLDDEPLEVEEPPGPAVDDADAVEEPLAEVYELPADDAQLDDELPVEDEEPATRGPFEVDEESPVAASEQKEDDAVRVADELDETLDRALSLGASTIQFAPHPRGLVARCRIDGSMYELGMLAEPLGDLVTELAARARIDPARRTPQEGLLDVTHDERTITLGVSAVPTTLGLQVSLRVPGHDGRPSSLSELGLRSSTDAALRESLRGPSGVVVVCGPAVSGRTSTLYAALHEVATPDRAIATIEDPIERPSTGIAQLEVNPASGMTFARGLRTILRSDPDVVLVGDLRDGETAQIAFRGARAERILLASLDAPTAAAATVRLASLGVDPRLLASTLSCVVAQSLMRRVCPDCRETYYASAEEIDALGRPQEEAGRRLLARGRGCPSCRGTGYRGWVAVFECLPLIDAVRTLIQDGAATAAIREAAVAAGMTTLHDEAVGLCLDGVTTSSEVRLVAVD